MTFTGTADCVQHTIRVSGGGNGPASTSHIALFRVDGRQCTMTTSKPLSVANGDRVTVSGKQSRSGFKVYAVHNTTTGITSHSGIAGKIILGLIFPVFGLLFCGIASIFLGGYSALLYLGFIACSVYLLYQASMAALAKRRVTAPGFEV